MSDNRSIELHVSGGQKSQEHDHHDHHHDHAQQAQKYRHHLTQCVLVVAIILLALTAQVFRKDVFATPNIKLPAKNLTADCVAPADSRCLTAPVLINDIYCYVAPAQNECGPAGFSCWQGSCINSNDACYGQVCDAPVDTRCAVSNQGICKDGECHYTLLNDYTPCNPKYNEDNTTLRGWTCQKGVCTSPVTEVIANYAYQHSIHAGIVIAALTIEVLFTGAFTTDLVFLAINFGVILLGFDGRFQDLGLEVNTGVGRTQLAFGLILGGLSVIFGGHLLRSNGAREAPSKGGIATAVLFIFFHGVTIGLVSHVIATVNENYANGQFDNDANIASNWAYPASIFAAAVALALAFTILYNGKPSSGFAALTFVTGVIELAWASNHQDADTVGSGDFTGTVLAWQSFAIISSIISIVLGLFYTFTATKGPGFDHDGSGKNLNRGFAFVSVIIFWTLIGIVASLFQNNFLDRDVNEYGVSIRQVESDKGNFGNQVSGFAWEHSIWSAAVASSWALESLIGGHSSGGITALTLTFAANLVGWAAEHNNIGSVRFNFASGEYFDELRARTRAWEALALVAGVLAFIFALLSLNKSSAKPSEEKAKISDEVPVHHTSIGEGDKDAFATRAGH